MSDLESTFMTYHTRWEAVRAIVGWSLGMLGISAMFTILWLNHPSHMPWPLIVIEGITTLFSAGSVFYLGGWIIHYAIEDIKKLNKEAKQ